MKKIILICFVSLFLVSCAPTRQSTQFYGYFDTVVTLDGYFEGDGFTKASKIVEDTLKEYDEIFDIYTDGELKLLNERGSLAVSDELLGSIEFGIKAEKETRGYCNIAMGSVLSLWHEAREAETPYLPEREKLVEAMKHTDINKIEISGDTVALPENMTLDMGAIAKGIVSDVLRERLSEAGFDNLFVNMGGNVVAIGDKDGEGWSVGVQNPDGDGIAEAIKVSDACLVTSGSYQRYFEYEGEKYHHIISPDTLFPSNNFSSVSVLYENGAWADALSTALFNMTIDEGKAVLEGFDGIGVMWITADGEKAYYGEWK